MSRAALKRISRSFLVAAGCTVLILLLIGGELFSTTRKRASNLLYSEDRQSENIIIVSVDDAALQAYGRSPTTWSREEYIPVIEALAAAGARVIGLELLFPEPAPGDAALEAALRAARTSDNRTRFVLTATGGGRPQPVTLPDGRRAARFSSRLLPVTALANAADYVGFSDSLLDESGSVCCQFTLISSGENIYPSFSLAMYLAYLRIPPDSQDAVIYNEHDRLFITPERSLIVDEYGQWLQNYTAPTGRGFMVLPFVDVAQGSADLSVVRDRIVLIGLHNAAGAVDTYRVPISQDSVEMSGVEIQANAIETLLRNNALRLPERPLILLMIFGLALLSALIYEHLRWYLRPVAAILLLIALVAAASYAFVAHRLLIGLLDGGLAILLPMAVSILVHLQHEANQRQIAEFAAGIANRERRLLQDVIMGSPAPTAVLNRDLSLMRLNRALDTLLDEPDADKQNISLLVLLENEGMEAELCQRLRTSFVREQDFQMELIFKERSYQCAANWLPRLNLWVIAWADVSMLAELNEVKRHMLLMVSHDLRNPLSSVFLQLHQLKRLLGTSNPTATKSIEALEVSAKSMQFILTDVVDLEQVRTLSFPTQVVDLKLIVQDIITRYRADADHKKQTLTVVQDTQPLAIHGNHGQITQMVANLISNAVKYTPDGGSVHIRLNRMPNGKVRLEVEDTGIGIPRDAQGKLFTEFYRVKSRATSGIPGTGLGLSLVRTIVKKYGGQIWFESQEGLGTTFYVEFPAALPESDAVQHPAG